MPFELRASESADADAVNAVALSALEQYSHYNDWDTFSKSIGNMAALSDSGKIIIAESQNCVIGAVTCIDPHKPKAAFSNPIGLSCECERPAPLFRGLGVNRSLVEECIQLARRDRAKIVALHTTKLMSVELSMHERMGFKLHQEAPEIFGVP